MRDHLRANLWLLGLTLGICCVLYPLVLWLVGQTAFPTAARGSLITDPDGKVRGSRLIAQPFTDAKYFWPRPSAVGYNAAASGGSNYAASNPLLRDRVARQLGPLVRYARGDRKEGKRAGPDIEKWFIDNPGLLGTWASQNPTLAARWVKDDANHEAVGRWLLAHVRIMFLWLKKHPGTPTPYTDKAKDWPDSLAVEVLVSFAKVHPDAWPVVEERKGPDGKTEKHLTAQVPDPPGKKDRKDNTDLQGVLFDFWLQKHPGLAERLQKVPADMVMASGSGLDPHITLSNALYQLDDHVAQARASQAEREREEVRQEIETLLRQRAFKPLGGLAGGEPLVNVLEINRALDRDARFKPEAGE
jgi:K+-transporting ATPase ATPase C chain